MGSQECTVAGVKLWYVSVFSSMMNNIKHNNTLSAPNCVPYMWIYDTSQGDSLALSATKIPNCYHFSSQNSLLMNHKRMTQERNIWAKIFKCQPLSACLQNFSFFPPHFQNLGTHSPVDSEFIVKMEFCENRERRERSHLTTAPFIFFFSFMRSAKNKWVWSVTWEI